MKTAREAERVMAPCGVRCRLCKLDADDPEDGGVFRLTVMYGGPRHGDQGNELAALWRSSWVCNGCLAELVKAWKKDGR